jgi:hypothetical protein
VNDDDTCARVMGLLGQADAERGAAMTAMAMTAAAADPADRPMCTRRQAEAVFGHVRLAAARGVSGPPGEQLVPSMEEYLSDTVGFWADLGAYDYQLIGRLAGMLDATDVAVLASWFYRVKGDVPDQDLHIAAPARRHLQVAE